MTVKQDEPDIPVVNVTHDEQQQLQQQQAHYNNSVTVATATAVPVAVSTVDVVAPTNMAEGYQFNVDSGGGKIMRVSVPPGGVQAGQRFSAIILSETTTAGGMNQSGAGGAIQHQIPTGRWRDDLCDCCQHGCCHSFCCLAFWCTACALGQVMTRLNLDKCANPLPPGAMPPTMSTFRFLFILTTIYYVTTQVLGVVANVLHDEDIDGNNTNESEDSGPGLDYEDVESDVLALLIIRDIIRWGFFIFILVIACTTRSYIRNKYQIPAGCCGGCEDCCCSFWCLPCTVCQMGRHTVNYNQYAASCCTPNGLAPGAPNTV